MKENIVRLAAKLYDARDTLRAFYADKYQSVVGGYLPFMNAEMQRQGCAELPAAIALIKRLDESDVDNATMAKLIVMALAVEMCEGIFALPAIGIKVRYRATHPAYPGKVAEGSGEVCKYITAENAPAPHMRPPERMLFIKDADCGFHYVIKASEVVAA